MIKFFKEFKDRVKNAYANVKQDIVVYCMLGAVFLTGFLVGAFIIWVV